MTGGKGGKSSWTSLQSLSERFENVKKKKNLWKSWKWASCQLECINYSSHLKQRASAPTPRCPRALQLRNQRELSYRNQDLIKDLTAGHLSLLWSDPTFRFNRCINCAFTQQNCTLVRSLPTSERSRFLPVSARESGVWRTDERREGGSIFFKKQKISLNLRSCLWRLSSAGRVLNLWIQAHLSLRVLINCRLPEIHPAQTDTFISLTLIESSQRIWQL